MKSRSRFAGLTIALLLCSGKIFSQYKLITLNCDSILSSCDTTSIEYYDEQGRLFLKEKMDSPVPFIHYTYDQRGNLVLKQHKSLKGELVKCNRIARDIAGKWMTDSLTDANGMLLTLFKRTPMKEPYRYQVEWFFNQDTKAGASQIIQEDTAGREISNSTCYDNGSCLTYLFHYSGTKRIKQELWILQEQQVQPVLKETEEFYYTDETDQPAGSVRFMEPEHRATDHFKYVKSYD